MSIQFVGRESESPYLERVTVGSTRVAGNTVRPAENHWHMVFVQVGGGLQTFFTPPWTTPGRVTWGEGADILWVRFRLGTFMPHLPTRNFLDQEMQLPQGAHGSFWLHGTTWETPTYENVETFIARLARAGVLVRDPLIETALRDEWPQMGERIAERTMRHRFLQATGLTQTHIRQAERAKEAAALLGDGTPILDVVEQLGYYDQPHLTRLLKRYTGRTPAQVLAGR